MNLYEKLGFEIYRAVKELPSGCELSIEIYEGMFTVFLLDPTYHKTQVVVVSNGFEDDGTFDEQVKMTLEQAISNNSKEIK